MSDLGDLGTYLKIESNKKLDLIGGALTGPLSTTSTVDGRNVSVDGTKLDNLNTVSEYTSQLLLGSIGVDNLYEVPAQTAITYTGNGTSQAITTGISSIDFTQANNGTGYYLARATGGSAVIADSSSSSINTQSTSGSTSIVDTGDSTMFSVGDVIFVTRTSDNVFVLKATITSIIDNVLVDTDGVYTQELVQYLIKTVSTSGNIDFSQGYLHPDDGTTIIDGVSKVHIKNRIQALDHIVSDGIRGATNYLHTNTTSIEDSVIGRVTSFDTNGFTVGDYAGVNSNLDSFIVYQTIYNNIKWGTTNHGKLIVTAYNPQSLDTMIYYEGSGIAGHELNHKLGRELGFWTTKGLNNTFDWYAGHGNDNAYLILNSSTAGGTVRWSNSLDSLSLLSSSGAENVLNEIHILYGFANAYYDNDGKLIGNKEAGTYIGTGVAGNEVKTLGKPAELVFKGLGQVSDWYKIDNQRADFRLLLNISVTEGDDTSNTTTITSSGFTQEGVDGVNTNIANEKYLYIVSYDTKYLNTGAFQLVPSSTSNIIVDCKVNLVDGTDVNGRTSTTLALNGVVDTSLVTEAGEYYVVAELGDTL